MDYRQPSSNTTFQITPFDKLTIEQLYAIARLRAEVFMIEQGCLEPDLDNKDQAAWHITAHRFGEIIGTARLLMPDAAYPGMASIGRVAVAKKHRGYGLGQALMAYAVEQCQVAFPKHSIAISAQHHLSHFYGSFGFVEVGDVYLEDGIEHVKMVNVEPVNNR